MVSKKPFCVRYPMGALQEQNDEPVEVVEQVQLRHDDKERRHVHKRGENAEKQRHFHHHLAAFEAETGHRIRCENDENGGKDTAENGYIKGIAQPYGIVAGRRLFGKEVDPRGKAERLGEESDIVVNGACGAERRSDQPHARKEKDKGNDDEQEIRPCGIENALCADTAV